MKTITLKLIVLLAIIIDPAFISIVSGQEDHPSPTIFVGGGALPKEMYKEFLKLTGPDAKLVVVPTASNRDVDVEKIESLWLSRGFPKISIMHTRDKVVASSEEFIAPLKEATAIWFSGGSQQNIADAYLGTEVEKEVYKLMERGGVIGGSSAGAAIMSKVMIAGGGGDGKLPKITTGFQLLPGTILDQHFLKRNRLSRLIEAVRSHPELVGFGIDEGTAIVLTNNEYKVVGKSYVMRIEMVYGAIKIDAFEDGDTISKTGVLTR